MLTEKISFVQKKLKAPKDKLENVSKKDNLDHGSNT